jgi:tetratricopeptide (TPR) repeat protein
MWGWLLVVGLAMAAPPDREALTAAVEAYSTALQQDSPELAQKAVALIAPLISTKERFSERSAFEWAYAMLLARTGDHEGSIKAYTAITRDRWSPYRQMALLEVLRVRADSLRRPGELDPVGLARDARNLPLPPPGTPTMPPATERPAGPIRFALSAGYQEFLTACDQALDAHFDLRAPDDLIGGPRALNESVEQRLPYYAWLATNIAFAHGMIDAGGARAEAIARRFPTSPPAADAAMLHVLVLAGTPIGATPATRAREQLRQYTALQVTSPALRELEDALTLAAATEQLPTNPAAAGEALRGYVWTHPEDPRAEAALHNAAIAFRTAGRDADARDMLAETLRRWPTGPGAREATIELAYLEDRAGNAAAAAARYAAFLQNWPGDSQAADVRVSQALALSRLPDAAAAARALEAAAIAHPDGEALAWRATEAFGQVSEQDQLAAYRRYLAAFPSGPTAHRVVALDALAHATREAKTRFLLEQQLDAEAARGAPLDATTAQLAGARGLASLQRRVAGITVPTWSPGAGRNRAAVLARLREIEPDAIPAEARRLATAYPAPEIALGAMVLWSQAELRAVDVVDAWRRTVADAPNRGSPSPEDREILDRSNATLRDAALARLDTVLAQTEAIGWTNAAAAAQRELALRNATPPERPTATLTLREVATSAVDALRLAGQLDQAEAAAREVLGTPEAAATLARVLAARGRTIEAKAWLEQALGDDGCRTAPAVVLRTAAALEDRPAAARAWIGCATATHPSDAASWAMQGGLAVRDHRYAAGLTALDQAWALQPSAAIAHDRGVALRGLRRNDEAREAYQSAIQLDPKEPEVWRSLATLEGDGARRGAEAIAALDRYLALGGDASAIAGWREAFGGR